MLLWLIGVACKKSRGLMDHILLHCEIAVLFGMLFFSSVRLVWVMLVSSFFELLYSIRLRQGSEDKIYWILSKRPKFEVSPFIMCCSLQLVPLFPGRVF